MSDPLSVAGTAVGIVSLGLQVVQGLYDYCRAVKNQDADIAHTTQKLAHLLEVMNSVSLLLEERKFRTCDRDTVAAVEGRILVCEKNIKELEEEAKKFGPRKSGSVLSATKTLARRAVYRFRQSTLQSLEKHLDETINHLSFALQLLQQKDVSRIRNHVEDSTALLGLMRAEQVNKDIRDWLKAPDATIDFNSARKKSHPGTGLWLANNVRFLTWLENSNSFLWINGFAGSGKSVLSSTAIQHTFARRTTASGTGIAFFFFTFRDTSKQTLSSLLRAVVLQLSGQLDNDSTLSKLHNTYRNVTPPDDALFDCLKSLIQSFQRVYIIIDAIDESPRDKHREDVLETLQNLRTWAEPRLHLMVTSRDEVDIRDALEASVEDCISMRNESVNGDIASYVTQQLREKRQLRKWENFHERIETVLTERAEGVQVALSFRWVDCQLRAVANCPRSEDSLDRLLKSLPQSLDETYERMLLSIPVTSRQYARQILLILCCADEPLEVGVLCDALAVELEPEPRYNAKRKLEDLGAILQVCPGFLDTLIQPNWGSQETHVQIAHFSVQEYLESDRILQQPSLSYFHVRWADANAEMTRTCLTALQDPQYDRSDFRSNKKRQFANDYAGSEWLGHYQKCNESLSAKSHLLQVFQGPPDVLFKLGSPFSTLPRRLNASSAIFLAADWGLESIVAVLLLENNVKVDEVQQFHGRVHDKTALLVASRNLSARTVQLLIDRGAEVNFASAGETPLINAASAGRANIVQLLLENDADINPATIKGWTPLLAAVVGGNKDVVRLLIDRGADVNAECGYGTPLHNAMLLRDREMAELLVEQGGNLDALSGRGESVLLLAITNLPDLDLVRFLLERGADPNTDPGLRGLSHSLLEWAGTLRRWSIVRQLLDHGAHPYISKSSKVTVLQHAARHKVVEVVAAFVKAGMDPTICGPVEEDDGMYAGNALDIARRHDNQKVVEYLEGLPQFSQSGGGEVDS